MRLLLGSVLVATMFFACAGSETVLVVSGDGGGGGGDASSSSCTPLAEADRAALCGAETTKILLSCAAGMTPPSSACAPAILANSYCCPSDSMSGSDSGTDTGSSTDLNPYGVPYPTDHIGTNPRAGSTRGDRVQNLAFQGYRPTSSVLGQVSLASLYDPDGKTYDVVFLVGGTLWSSPDQLTLDSLKSSSKRIATFAVLGEGTSPGQAATLANLATYRTKNSFATTALDSGFNALGAFFDKSAVPFVMVIDARTMEIVSAGVGGISSTSEVDAQVTAVTSRPAAY